MLDICPSSYFDYTAVLDGSYAALALVGLPFSVSLVASDRRRCAFLDGPGGFGGFGGFGGLGVPDDLGGAEMRRNFAGLNRSEGGWGQNRRQTVDHGGRGELDTVRKVELGLELDYCTIITTARPVASIWAGSW